ncbi:MAG TPA: AAA family ATPase [Candidatus Paceibacterota bacterium]|nr:AAA family ATPase [Candidatus Paceibacterota bacterium]
MRLASLELVGFKSFGKKTTLTFESSISAIVGPNGSGKSNVAEAFRFALGEQSLKSLRGKKGEDMIYNGGTGASRLNRASAKLTFDNGNRVLPIDFDQVSLERVVHRDGLNEYFINGTRVRLKDVTELLAHANIGASGHHIISQGEADRILMASSIERRGMIEDALGLKLFQYRKRESEKKLEKTEENIERVESLRREIGPHISFLKKQVDKLEKAAELRKELVDKAVTYCTQEAAYLRHARNILDTEYTGPHAELQKLTERIHHVQADIRSRQEGDAQKQKHEHTIAHEMDAELRSLRSKSEAFRQDIAKKGGEISILSQMLKRAEDSAASESSITISRNELTHVVSTIESIVGRLEHAADLSAVKELSRQLTVALQTLHEKVSLTSRNREEEKSLHEQIERKNVDIQVLQQELTSVEKEREELEAKVKATEKAEVQSSYELLALEREMVSLQSEVARLQSVVSQTAVKKQYLSDEEAMFKQDVTELAHLCGRQVLEYEQLSSGIEKSIFEDRGAQKEARRALERMRMRIEDAGLGTGDEVIKEYKETSERDEFLKRELQDLEMSKTSLSGMVKELDNELGRRFTEGMKKINDKFKEFFTLMFGGGDAKLSVEQKQVKTSADPEEGEEVPLEVLDEETLPGIEVSVSLPRKKVSGLTMLSGGERALTSIALLFALSQVNPPPFIILDETDAALDESNSRKYGDMIEALAKHSQLILITHNRETMSRATILYGVTMSTEGSSSVLSVKFDEAIRVAK